MLVQIVKRIIEAYKAMENDRYGNSVGLRVSKVNIFSDLETCDSDEKRCQVINSMVNDSGNGKLRFVLELLQTCAKAYSNDADYTALLVDIVRLKNQISQPGSLLGQFLGSYYFLSNVQFDETCKSVCDDIAALIKQLQASTPVLQAQEERLVQAKNELESIYARHDIVLNDRQANLDENERLKKLIEELKQKKQKLESKEVEQLAKFEQQQETVNVALLHQKNELTQLTEKLNILYHSNQSLRSQYNELQLKFQQEQAEKYRIQEQEKEALDKVNAERIHGVEILQSVVIEKSEQERKNKLLGQELEKFKQESKLAAIESQKAITALTVELEKEKAERKRIEEYSRVKQKEISDVGEVSQARFEANNKLTGENASLIAELEIIKKHFEIKSDQLEAAEAELVSLTNRLQLSHQQTNKLDLEKQQMIQQLDSVAEYLATQQSNFIYDEEEDKGRIKPGDIKRLIELAGADETFIERFERFVKAIKDKIDSKKSSDHNKPYILELKVVEDYFEKYIKAYDVLFKRSNLFVPVSLEEEKKVEKMAKQFADEAASKAEQMIGFHNATERVVQQHLSYEKKSNATSAEIIFIDEANKSVNLNKCRSAFYEELLKRASNLLPKKGESVSIVADFSDRLSRFITRNAPALKAAVSAVQAKEKKVAAMSKPLSYAGGSQTLFPLGASSANVPELKQAGSSATNAFGPGRV